ncbi:MAG: c-type cytochrome [Saprospiraceae bacterium]|nr:c-type cytochrome [Saprospiraceae bacterium]
MALEGDRKRFTHAWIKYEGGSLPSRYHNKMLAINPLQSYLQLTQMLPDGSTFKNIDEERILETPDHWFRPVDIKAGPEGAVYLADWYDSRLSHVDPRDTWHKKTNKWFRQQAQRQFADRKNPLLLPALLKLLQKSEGQVALEALWAIHASAGLNESTSLVALNHPDPFVRMWGIRLLGDQRIINAKQSAMLGQLARSESHPEVRSQIAATAKRLDIANATAIVKGLLSGSDDADDRDIPLQIWWAIEDKIEKDKDGIVAIFKDPSIWKNQIIQNVVLSRLAQRLIMPDIKPNYAAVTHLLGFAPSTELAKPLVVGIYEGLRGKEMSNLPDDFRQALQPYAHEIEAGSLSFGIRTGDSLSVQEAISIIGNEKANLTERLTYTRSLAEFLHPAAVPVLLEVIENQRSPLGLKQSALMTLRSYHSSEIGTRIAAAYPDKLRADPDVREAALTLLTSDPDWAKGLLRMIDSSRQIAKSDIPAYLVLPLTFLGDSALSVKIEHIWPDMAESSRLDNEKDFKRIVSLVKEGKGIRNQGREVFAKHCGACHKIEGNGSDIGPDLGAYDNRNIQDLLYNIVYPNADIREGYVNYLVTTKDGKSWIGTIQSRQGDLVELRTSSGQLIKIAQENMNEMEAIERSLMPEGLLRNLTNQEIQDLFTFMANTP